MKKWNCRKYYTLVEIMTVIVIAALLFGIGIPAFTTMIQGSNMTVAIRQLSAKIQAARAYAVTNRCRVALLLVEDETASKIVPDAGFSAYRVCVIEDDALNFQSWIEDEDWRLLPKGVLRKALNSSDYENIAEIPKKSEESLWQLEDTDGAVSPLKALVFQKDGKLTKSANIELYQGRCLQKGSTISPVPTGGTDHKLSVNQYSGKVTVTVPES